MYYSSVQFCKLPPNPPWGLKNSGLYPPLGGQGAKPTDIKLFKGIGLPHIHIPIIEVLSCHSPYKGII